MRLSWLIHYAVLARPILDRNVDHRGLQLALSEINALLDDAQGRAANGELLAPDMRLWLGIARRGVRALDVLTMVCAALLYEQLSGDPSKCERAYHHRVARAVVCLDKLKDRTSGGLPKDLAATGQRMLGRFLLERYSAVGVSLLAKVKMAEEKERERWQLFTTPLK